MVIKFYQKLKNNLNSNNLFYSYYGEKYYYKDIKKFALKFSNVIRDLPNKRNKICVISDKCFDLYATSLSIILTNNIWVPISASSPDGRVFEMIEKLDPDLLIVQNISTLKMLRIKSFLKKKNIKTISFAEIKETKPLLKIPESKINHNDVSMIFFTSGSTGNPKGVKITHKSYISSLVQQTKNLYQKQKNLTFGDYHDISFVISLNILLPCFYLKSVISPAIDMKDILFPVDHAVKNQVNTLITVPTTMNRIKNYYKKINNKFKLKILILCGEPFYCDMMKYLIKKNFSKKIFNCYGSTELSPWVFYYELNKIDFKNINKSNVVPIGSKFKGVIIKIIDKILYIGGSTLSLGYLDKNQNKESFKTIGKKIYYKTNDIIEKVNNKYFVLGRSDSIVKISGYRVELFEIDNRLRKINFVTNSYVFVKEIDDYEKYICACVETKKLNHVFIQNQLKKHLPTYMLPKQIKIFKKFPINKNYKVDRVSLKNEFYSNI